MFLKNHKTDPIGYIRTTNYKIWWLYLFVMTILIQLVIVWTTIVTTTNAFVSKNEILTSSYRRQQQQQQQQHVCTKHFIKQSLQQPQRLFGGVSKHEIYSTKGCSRCMFIGSPLQMQRNNHQNYNQQPQQQIRRQTTVRQMSNTDSSDDTLTKGLVEISPEEDPNNNDWSWIGTLILPLWFVYITNQWSRYSISYLVDFSDVTATTTAATTAAAAAQFTAMNLDIGFDQVQYGLLASVAFTCLYAIASLFAGVIADLWDRKLLTVLSCLLWASATLGTAFADSYGVVVIWRIVMGFACAFATPAAYTFIQQKVPPNRVALGSSIYGTGVALGSGLSSLSIILDNAIGWRQTEILIACLGFLAAIVSALTLPNDPKVVAVTPTQQQSKESIIEKNEKPTLSFSNAIGDVQQALTISRVQWLYVASFLRFCSGLCIGVWGAPYFRMVFPTFQEEYSVTQAGISVFLASASGLLGGAAADYLAGTATTGSSSTPKEEETQPQSDRKTTAVVETNEPDPVGRRLWVPVIGSLLAAPTWYWAIQYGIGTDPSFDLSMTWLAVEYFVAECWFGPTISSLQATVGPKIGGTAQGLFSLTGAMANSAPALLGYLYGQAVSTTTGASTSTSSTTGEELATLLIGSVCFGYVSSAFCFGMASRAGPPQTITTNTTKAAKVN